MPVGLRLKELRGHHLCRHDDTVSRRKSVCWLVVGNLQAFDRSQSVGRVDVEVLDDVWKRLVGDQEGIFICAG